MPRSLFGLTLVLLVASVPALGQADKVDEYIQAEMQRRYAHLYPSTKEQAIRLVFG